MTSDISPTENPWASVDPLGEVLHFLHMNGVIYTRSEFTAPWALALPVLPDCLMFHVVTSGRSWLEVEGAEPCLLQPGDFALIPHGQGHRLMSAPGVPAAKLFDLPASKSASGMRSCGMVKEGRPRVLCAVLSVLTIPLHTSLSGSCQG